MKIVHEVNQMDFGGVERVVNTIVKYDKGNEHVILTYKDGPFRKVLESSGAKVFVMEEDEIPIEADVIHIHTGGCRSELAEYLNGAFPVVETIHSPVRSVVPDHLVSQRVGVTAAVARRNKDAIAILNGLDLDFIDPLPVDFKTASDQIVVGRVGRVAPDKGLETWLLTCYYLQKKGLKILPVVVGGPGRDQEKFFGKAKLLAESLPVKDVVWIGHVDEPMRYYTGMDVFLYPSPTEGFGLVFAEAMIMGVPVVSWKTDVNFEVMGGYSFLVDKKDGIPGLVQAVEKAITPELRDEVASMAQEYVKTDLSAERMVAQYQELYERCHNDFNWKDRPQEAVELSC